MKERITLFIATISTGLAGFGNLWRHFTNTQLMPQWTIAGLFCISILTWIALPILEIMRRRAGHRQKPTQ